MKKVIIVGAGAQGNVISGILAKAPEVSKIMLVDLDVERAAELVAQAQRLAARHAEAATANEYSMQMLALDQRRLWRLLEQVGP